MRMAFWTIAVQGNGILMGVGLAISVDKMQKYRLVPNMIEGISKCSNYSTHNDKW